MGNLCRGTTIKVRVEPLRVGHQSWMKPLKKIAIAVAVSLVAGLAAGAWLADGPDQTPGSANAVPDTSTYFDPNAPTAERLAALEQIVAQERDARAVLEDQMYLLMEEIERIDSEGPAVISGEVAEMLAQQQVDAVPTQIRERQRDTRSGSQRERQLERLVGGGFTEDRAAYILDRATEYQYEAMQAQYAARQDGGDVDWLSREMNPDFSLREELGDMEYEQYLQASGQPSAVAVQSVMATSPASRVGLQAGDQIVSYNGRRIFNTRELQAETFSAQANGDVVLQIVRDGTQMQITVPAGPMGITATGSRGGPNRFRGGN